MQFMVNDLIDRSDQLTDMATEQLEPLIALIDQKTTKNCMEC